MAAELRKILQARRTSGKVEARAKSTGSVIGKAYRKPETYSSLAGFRDLAGARVLLPFVGDIEPIARELDFHPDLTVVTDEMKTRKPDELRYQARHLDIALDAGAFGLRLPEGFGHRRVFCEIQLQTLAQQLWASVSHIVTYKRELPDEVHRRMNRLVVLCEMFDDEAAASQALALANVDTIGAIADEVQRYYFGFTGAVHDADQAMSLVGRLLPALAENEVASYPQLLESFVSEYSQRLSQLLIDRPEARNVPWLLRPEVILILERLTRSPARLRQVWNAEFPEADLNALEAAWGPVDSI